MYSTPMSYEDKQYSTKLGMNLYYRMNDGGTALLFMSDGETRTDYVEIQHDEAEITIGTIQEHYNL